MFSDPVSNVEQFGISEGMHVADFGSGSGFYTLALAKAVGDIGKVYAIDIQKDLLQRLKNEAIRARMHNVEVVWGDLEHIGGMRLREASLDAVVLANIFFQVEDKTALVLEAKRILKRGSRALVVEWADSFGNMGAVDEAIVSPETIRELFKNNGFSFDREISAGEHHYGLIFRKN
ncbi:MAG: class I SAM-dependent methyltransferase [Candidatus Paceibacterota bacterium]